MTMRDDYTVLLRQVILEQGKALKGPLFVVAAFGLYEAYLEALPPEARQEYTCRACQDFVERFGRIVTVTDDGIVKSPIWVPELYPEFFRPAVARLQRFVEGRPIEGVFLAEESVWGKPTSMKRVPDPTSTVMTVASIDLATGAVGTEKKIPGSTLIPDGWRHMHIIPPKDLVFKRRLLDAGQVAAEKLQDLETLRRGLKDFPLSITRQAKALLETETLYRSEKCLGVATWLVTLQESLEGRRNPNVQTALLWRAVATAPAGFCHIRSTMISTLLEDIAEGMPFEQVKARFAAKMHPLQYQRPTSAPSEGQIDAAEKIIKELGVTGALDRRFARLEDLTALWTPTAPKPSEVKEGVFGHLRKGAGAEAISLAPTVTMTWEKFARTVLPKAQSIMYVVPRAMAPYTSFTTAANPDAPIILQWDNPVSWYLYHGGSMPGAWNLVSGVEVKVTAVVAMPHAWTNPGLFKHHGEGVTFILEGCRNTAYHEGAGFFVEQLRSEYHGIHHTLEEYIHRAKLAGLNEATASGVRLQKGTAWESFATFKVTVEGITTTYKLDRWD